MISNAFTAWWECWGTFLPQFFGSKLATSFYKNIIFECLCEKRVTKHLIKNPNCLSKGTENMRQVLSCQVIDLNPDLTVKKLSKAYITKPGSCITEFMASNDK